LILFALGLPVLAYTAQQLIRSPSVLAKVALGIVLVAGANQFKIQGEDLKGFASTTARSQTIANYLKQEYAKDPSLKVFCDHTEVRVISGIPRDQFFDSWEAPKDREGFVRYLRWKGIKYLVIPEESETSIPSQLFPGLIKDSGGAFEAVIPPPEGTRLDSLYRVRPEGTTPPG